MNSLDQMFPKMPSYRGVWAPVFLEPIVGSGERVTIAVIAISKNNEYKVIQAIRNELLDCLYGMNSVNIQDMIDFVIKSFHTTIKKNNTIDNWVSPFDGVILGKKVEAIDESLDGILRQAIRFSSSLSTLALDADRNDDEVQPRRYAEQFSKNIQSELKLIKPWLLSSFNQRIKLSDAEIMTSYGFINDRYASNFGLLIPTRMSVSLNSVKAKLFDLEKLRKSQYLMKPTTIEVIIGTPYLEDPTLTDKSVERLKSSLEMIEEFAYKEDIKVFRAESAKVAAEHISLIAA